VPIVEPIHAREPLGAELEPRAVALEEGTAEAAAEQVADQVASRRRDPDEPDQRHQLDAAALGHHPSHDHGRLARHDQAHEGGRLQEGEGRHCRVGPGA
jgi:hypothetical protein